MDEIEAVLKKFVIAMSKLDIPYVIVGGFAVAGWGRFRATQDVDVIMQLRETDVPWLVRVLREGGFSFKAEDILDALRRKEHFSIFNSDSIYHVDAKGAYGKHESRTLQGRVVVGIRDYRIPISGLEDTFVNKLCFGREQDLEDALAIFIRNEDRMDEAALVSLCREYGVLRELRTLQRKARRAERTRREDDRHR